MAYIRKLEKKKLYSLVITLFIIFMIMTTTVASYSKGSVLDPIVYEMDQEATNKFDLYAEMLVNAMVSAFSPSFTIYRQLDQNAESGAFSKVIGLEDDISEARKDGLLEGELYLDDDYDIYKTNTLVGNIFTFAQRFGVVLATVLTVGFLGLCAVGRAEQIKDTPISLMIKYTVCMILIYFAWDIIFTLMQILGNVWTNYIMKIEDKQLTYEAFQTLVTKAQEKAPNGDTVVDAEYLQILGNKIKIAGWTALANFIFSLIVIFLKIKLLKQIFRLFMEIAERYFITTIMLFLFPAIAPSIISNSTSNIMHSYFRMFASQSFLLLIDTLFMKLYVILLMRGVFTSSLLGYVCSIALVKVFQKLDTYMAAMGLNVAQTGGGFVDSIGGSLFALSSILRASSHLRGGSGAGSAANAGRSLMESAVKTNDLAQYNAALAKTGQGPVTPQQFANVVAKDLHSSPTSVPTFKDATYTVGPSGVSSLAQQLNISQSGITSVLKGTGVDSSQIASIKQLDGSITPSNEAGSKFQLFDADGNSLGVVHGANGFANTLYGNDTSLSEPYLSQSEFSDMTGSVERPSDCIILDESSSGHQVYTVNGYGTADSHTYEVDMYAINPHYERDWHTVPRSDGSYIQWRERKTDSIKSESSNETFC